MNANELADYVDAREIKNPHLKEAATMLRQQQRTIDGDKRLIDLLYEKVEKLQAEIEELKTMRGNSVLVPSDKLKEMQEKLTKYELRHAEQRKRIEELEHMMEKASHHEAMAHAGGFEVGYQAAQADFNEENPVKEVFNTEPVAWILWWDNHPEWLDDNYLSTSKEAVEEFLPTVSDNPKVIPLYTHPAKTLTDEEKSQQALIHNPLFVNKQQGQVKQGCGFEAKTLTDEEIYKIAMEVQTGFLPQDDTLAFARAILKKANKK